MARRRKGLLDDIAALPWPVGLGLGVIAFIFIPRIDAAFAPLAWVFLVACAAAAGASFLRTRQRRTLLDTQSGLDSLGHIGWHEFELLVSEAFRRHGYQVEENGLGGKDGGIDLILSRDGRRTLVQCKQWRTRQIKAPTVREMWGLANHHRADAVKIVCIGDYTRDAAAFAEGKAIELINGERLLAMIREVQAGPTTGANRTARIEPIFSAERRHGHPACPSCGAEMTRRSNRRNGQPFWGCTGYPGCKGTRPA